MEEVERIRKKALDLYKRFIAIKTKKEEMLDEELKKPPKEQDLRSIASLEDDLAECDKTESQLDDIILGSFEKSGSLREDWIKLEEKMGEL